MLGNWQRNIIVIFYLVGKVQITKAEGTASQNLDNTCTFTVTTGFFQLCGNINDNIGIHKIIPDFEHPSWVSCPTFMCLPSPLGEGVGVHVLLCFRVVVLYWNIIISSYNCKIMINKTFWSQKRCPNFWLNWAVFVDLQHSQQIRGRTIGHIMSTCNYLP